MNRSTDDWESMNTPATSENSPKPLPSRKGKLVLIALAFVALAIGGLLYWASIPSETERRLVGIWRTRVEGTSNYELMRFGRDRRIVGFDAATSEFTNDEGLWSVVDDRLHIQRSSSGPRVLQLIENAIAKLSGSSRVDTLYDIEWKGNDTCTIIWVDNKPNETPMTIHLERIKDFDASHWDERGLPMPSTSTELK